MQQTDSLRKNLNDTGMGNYPPLVKMMAKIGRAIGDDKIVTAVQTPKESKKDIAEIFYGSNN